MIDILTMLMSVASAIPLIAATSPPYITSTAAPAVTVNAQYCYLWSQWVARRDDYIYTPGIGGHKLHAETVQWNEARLTCEKEGGHLAIINSAAESEAIADLFRKAPAPPGTNQPNYAHIGFHDLFTEGQFVTIHGQSLAQAGFATWASGEPDNWRDNENCGSVYKNGLLNDITCNSDARFICEVPLPST